MRPLFTRRRQPRTPTTLSAGIAVFVCTVHCTLVFLGPRRCEAPGGPCTWKGPSQRQQDTDAGRMLDRRSCVRTLWLSGLQAVTANGSQSHYLDSATSYLRYYAAALKSARRKAPSLLPVLIFLNDPPARFLEWATAQGCLVIQHGLSFQRRIEKAVKADPSNPRLARMEHLAASYARWDIPAIMQKVRAALVRTGRREGVDYNYVLWTDPDVLFEQDIDSCSLARPRLFSIGAEMIPGTLENCGVVYFNVSAFQQSQAALLDFADGRGWKFEHDQELIRLFYRRWMITALPDAYNYKPYWGKRAAPERILAFNQHEEAEVAIIHTHGPKPEIAVCVVDYIIVQQIPVHKNRNLVLKHAKTIAALCNMTDVLWLEMMLCLVSSGVAADGGWMYKHVHGLQNSLCPGLCWQ